MDVALILTSLAGLALAVTLAWVQERRQQALARCLRRHHCGSGGIRP